MAPLNRRLRAYRLLGVALLVVVGATAAAAQAAPEAPSTGEAGDQLPPRTPRAVDDPEIVEAAAFVMEELRELSDSGVYRSLELARINEAATQEGVFHHNTFLDVVLASPYFAGGVPESEHQILVMRARDDGVLSFAIDEFPEMDEDAIEAFWIDKVEAHRAFREEVFASIEADHEAELSQARAAQAADAAAAGAAAVEAGTSHSATGATPISDETGTEL